MAVSQLADTIDDKNRKDGVLLHLIFTQVSIISPVFNRDKWCHLLSESLTGQGKVYDQIYHTLNRIC